MECPLQSKNDAGILEAYCSRNLDPESAVALERHLESCPACRRFREAQQAVWEALEGWEAAPVSAGFNRRLYQRIEEQEPAGWRRRLPYPLGFVSWKPALSVAVASLTLVAAFLLQSPHVRQYHPVQHVETVDVEQVERSLDDLEMLNQLTPVAKQMEADHAEPRSM